MILNINTKNNAQTFPHSCLQNKIIKSTECEHKLTNHGTFGKYKNG